jgi:hypothetical protein
MYPSPSEYWRTVARNSPVQQELHATKTALDLADARNGAGGVEHFGLCLLDVLALTDGEDQTFLSP